MNDGRSAFDGYDKRRRALLSCANAIAGVWSEFTAARSLAEELTEQDVGADDADPVTSHLFEARTRLERTVIEVGIFGHINRGKSTLLNALLGLEVSSTRVTPETVVPVDVEYGDPASATVIFREPGDDGKEGNLLEVDMSPDEAVRATGERQPGGRVVVRVKQRVPADLLKAGIRFIDTPGLDDPDPERGKELEAMTLAELDRVTAAVLVMCSPPGVSGAETRLLQTFSDRQVDKTLFVCNLYTDNWEDEPTKTAVLGHVSDAVSSDTDGTASTSPRVYPVHAKRAWKARAEGDLDAYAASGVAELERDLESYLTEGAMADLLSLATRHLQWAVGAADERIAQRRDLLLDPGPLQQLRGERRSTVDAAGRRIEAICAQVRQDARSLGETLASTAREPYDLALREAASVTQRSVLPALEATWTARIETSKSRIAIEFDSAARELEARAKAELEAAFGADALEESELRLPDSIGSSSGGLVVSGVLGDRSGMVPVAASVGAIVGGSLAGGAGIALVALGPVGWIVGAAIGALMVGGIAAGAQNRLTAADRQAMVAAIDAQQSEATSRVRRAVEDAGDALAAEIRRRGEAYSRDAVDELDAVERMLNDPTRVQRELQRLNELAARLGKVDLSTMR